MEFRKGGRRVILVLRNGRRPIVCENYSVADDLADELRKETGEEVEVWATCLTVPSELRKGFTKEYAIYCQEDLEMAGFSPDDKDVRPISEVDKEKFFGEADFVTRCWVCDNRVE